MISHKRFVTSVINYILCLLCWPPCRHFTRTCAERQVVADSNQPSRPNLSTSHPHHQPLSCSSKNDVQCFVLKCSW